MIFYSLVQMRLLVFFRFSAKCFDVLAWPVLSLGYPICASIRAIESESNESIQNLVTYWVVFSLISLFDHTFDALLERIPLWPYMKLIVVCFLALPDFRGSYYAYEHIIHPCILAAVQFVTDQLHVPKDIFFQKNDFLAAAERYVAENGSESLAKLISEKAKNTDLRVAAIDISRVNTEKVVVLNSQLVQPSSHLVQKEIETKELKQLTDMAGPQCTQVNAMAADNDGARSTEGSSITSVVPVLKQVQEQKAWACALCQVTTSSEFSLKAHYQGKKHMNREAELKRMKLNKSKAKAEAASSRKNLLPNATPEKHAAAPEQKLNTGQKNNEKTKRIGVNVQNPPNTTPEKHAAAPEQKLNTGQKNNDKAKRIGVNVQNPPNATPEKHAAAPEQKLNTGQKNNEKTKRIGVDMQNPNNLKRHVKDIKQSKLWCHKCDIRCCSEIDMACHLKGRKHLARLEELKGSR